MALARSLRVTSGVAIGQLGDHYTIGRRFQVGLPMTWAFT